MRASLAYCLLASVSTAVVAASVRADEPHDGPAPAASRLVPLADCPYCRKAGLLAASQGTHSGQEPPHGVHARIVTTEPGVSADQHHAAHARIVIRDMKLDANRPDRAQGSRSLIRGEVVTTPDRRDADVVRVQLPAVPELPRPRTLPLPDLEPSSPAGPGVRARIIPPVEPIEPVPSPNARERAQPEAREERPGAPSPSLPLTTAPTDLTAMPAESGPGARVVSVSDVPPAPAAPGFGFLPVMLGGLAPSPYGIYGPVGNPRTPAAAPLGPPPSPSSPFGSHHANAYVPWSRGFRIADNQSPIPQDRIFYGFNAFDGLYGAWNRPTGAIRGIEGYRNTFGFETTVLDGRGSVGMQLPLENAWIAPATQGLQGNSTSVGNLALFSKVVLWHDALRRNLVSGGLAMSVPTGPTPFAGSPYSAGFRDVQLQPYLGYVWRDGDWFLQGFSAINAPTDQRDVTSWYNDIGLGYFLYRNPDPAALIGAIVPTFEVHVDDPLNHRGAFRAADPAGAADIVTLTGGSSVLIGRRTVASFGATVPITGPRPFAIEAVALLNVYFGPYSLAAQALPSVQTPSN